MKNIYMMYISYVIYAIVMFMAIICFVIMQLWRFDNAGKVCSGKYLKDGDDTTGYLVFEGLFLKWVIITIYIMFVIVTMTIVLVAFIFVQKKPADEVFT